MHRPSDGTSFNDTYMFKLAHDHHFIVIDKCLRAGITSDFLLEEKLEDHYDLDCDYYILQLGICDCAPRLFSKATQSMLSAMSQYAALSIISRLIQRYYRKRRLYYTKKRRIQNVSIEQFTANMQSIIKHIIHFNPRLKKIILINIAYPGPYLREKNYGMEKIIADYNQTLAELAHSFPIISVIDIWSLVKNDQALLLADAHHFNNSGHEVLYREILQGIYS